MARVTRMSFESIKEDLEGNDNVAFDDVTFPENEDDLIEHMPNELSNSADQLENTGDSLATAVSSLEQLQMIRSSVNGNSNGLASVSTAVESLMRGMGAEVKVNYATEDNAVQGVGGHIKRVWEAIIKAIKSAIKWVAEWFKNLFRSRNVDNIQKTVKQMIKDADSIDWKAVEKSKGGVTYSRDVMDLLTISDTHLHGRNAFDPAKVEQGIDALNNWVPDFSEMLRRFNNGALSDAKVEFGMEESDDITIPLPLSNIGITCHVNGENKFTMKVGSTKDVNYFASISDTTATNRIELTKQSYIARLENINKLVNRVNEFSKQASSKATELNTDVNKMSRQDAETITEIEINEVKYKANFNIQVLTSVYPQLAKYVLGVAQAYLLFIKANAKPDSAGAEDK